MLRSLFLRAEMLGYALSCAGNVLLLRRPEDTSAGEGISGRAFWESRYGQYAGHWSWRWGVRLIDAIFVWDRQGAKRHCELADLRDYERAKQKVRRFEGRAPQDD